MGKSILGISAFYHDSSAALLQNSEIVAAAQEERFSRIKGDSAFPESSVAYCLNKGGITQQELDYVVFYEKPYVKFERLLETYLAYAPLGLDSYKESMPVWAGYKLNILGILKKNLRNFKDEILFADHHESHAASAFFPSPYSEAAILTIDAVGEWATSSLAIGKKNELEMLRELQFPHSVGMLYSAFTYYCGFKVNSGEYKLMGLAPYGNPVYVHLIKDNVVDIKKDGSIELNLTFFNYCQGRTMTSEKFHRLFGGAPREPETMITQKDMDIAASIQVICEEIVLKMAGYLYELTGIKNLVLAGGVALNCVANGRILREGPFYNVWIQPAAGDAGGSLGAALLVWHHVLGNERTVQETDSQKGSLLGPGFMNEEIGLFLDSVKANYNYISAEEVLINSVAHLIDKQNIIGWFQGRMEFGPRALGSRSIIGDARSIDMQKKMNLKIKYRESFRPFAPAVLREFAHTLFQVRQDEDIPYMQIVAPVLEEQRSKLSQEDIQNMKDSDLRVRVSVVRSEYPAITHVDYSARVQTVDEYRHGIFYRLLKRFYELTDSPVIINTSFNVRSEPIVQSPWEAYRCFMATDMDCLVLENFILLKKDQEKHSAIDSEQYVSEYTPD